MKKITNSKTYCVIGIANVSTIKDTVISISVEPAKFIDAQNMIIISFKTFLNPIEMKEIFNEDNEGSYFLFELNRDSALVKLDDADFHSYLFSDMDEEIEPEDEMGVIDTPFGPMGFNKIGGVDFSPANDMLDSIMMEIRSKKNNTEVEYTEEELSSYSQIERDELVDKLLSKKTLTDKDKKVLDFLVKIKD